MTEEFPTLYLGVLGTGTAGSQVIRFLAKQSEEFAARSGARMHVSVALVRTPNVPRNTQIVPELLTTSPAEVIDGMDIVIELIGGIEPTRTHILRALNAGISVVMSNKVPLAAHGLELYAVADVSGTDLYYEAVVAGAVPIVYGLREPFAGDRITRVVGIVNGTTNFIFDAMATRNLSYGATLKQAQELGSAEADPSADVERFDAAAKRTILVSLAFHTRVGVKDVEVEGITRITAEDMEEAALSNRTIKFLAIAGRRKNDQGVEGVFVRVHPTLIPVDSPPTSADGASNATLVEGENVGRLMFHGQGAGGIPTVSTVLPDLVAAAHHRAYGGYAPRGSVYAQLPLLESGENLSRFQTRLQVEDRLGVLAEVAGLFASNRVPIQVLHQQGDAYDGTSVITLTTHRAKEANLRAFTAALEDSDSVRSVMSTLHAGGE